MPILDPAKLPTAASLGERFMTALEQVQDKLLQHMTHVHPSRLVQPRRGCLGSPRTAHSPGRAIEIGYERALSAIVDANLTTLITAAVLFYFGAGPVRGFAVTLFFGVITSVFSAIYVTRLIIEAWFNWRKPKTLIV